MENSEEYKEYLLEYRGNPFTGLEYFITANSNNKKLKFNIDSGAECNLVTGGRFFCHAFSLSGNCSLDCFL